MTDESVKKLRSLLAAYAELKARARPAATGANDASDAKRRACAERLRNLVRPVLDRFMAELTSAGHAASTRDDTEKENAYPSVALSFTPHAGASGRAEPALASALMFKYDPRRGILVQRSIKPSPTKGGTVTASGDRIGTIGVDAVSTQWVETKTLAFVEDVLKVN